MSKTVIRWPFKVLFILAGTAIVFSVVPFAWHTLLIVWLGMFVASCNFTITLTRS